MSDRVYTYQDAPVEQFVQNSLDSALECKDESRTNQSQAEEADINTIVRRFGVTGMLPQGVRAPTYGDFTGVGDFRDALEAIRAAERSFSQMPADVRARFANDPASFVDFCSNPENIDEMRKLGLAVPAPVSESGDTSSGAQVTPS